MLIKCSTFVSNCVRLVSFFWHIWPSSVLWTTVTFNHWFCGWLMHIFWAYDGINKRKKICGVYQIRFWLCKKEHAIETFFIFIIFTLVNISFGHVDRDTQKVSSISMTSVLLTKLFNGYIICSLQPFVLVFNF